MNQGDNLPAAMIEAGVEAYTHGLGVYNIAEIVEAIYLAMNAARTPDTETLSTRDRELVERLRRTEPEAHYSTFSGAEMHSTDELVNPDGPEAADRLEALLSTRDDAPARPSDATRRMAKILGAEFIMDDAPDARPDVERVTLNDRIKQLRAERKTYFDVEGDGVDVLLCDIQDYFDRAALRASSLPLRGDADKPI